MPCRNIAASSLLCGLLVLGAGPNAKAEDPWHGKHLDEVTAILGPPNKIKGSGGSQILIYKLMVPGESPPLDPKIRLLQLPGIGLVAQVVRKAEPAREEVEFEPTQLDDQGRAVEGGYTTSQSASMSYDPKSGELERDWEPTEDPVDAKKITLKFQLDGDNHVQHWSVSPKKYLQADSGP